MPFDPHRRATSGARPADRRGSRVGAELEEERDDGPLGKQMAPPSPAHLEVAQAATPVRIDRLAVVVLHDVLAHTLSGVAVELEGLRTMLRVDPNERMRCSTIHCEPSVQG